jgi:V/A-type H+-transporting ATPase subunit E
MNMAEAEQTSSAVQDLIARIRDEGVQAGRQEAEQILADARRQAARMIEAARAEVKEMRQKARAEIQTEETAALEALKLAARDTGLRLEAEVVSAFESCVKRLVSPVAHDGSLIRALALVLAGHAVEEFVKDQEIQILVSDLLCKEVDESPQLQDRVRQAVLGITGEMLREGVELIPSSEVEGGARVRLVGENLEIDLTDDAIHRVLMKHLLPRFRRILEGSE